MAHADKTVIVTGGNSGLGVETARTILREGGRVARRHRRPQPAALRRGGEPAESRVRDLASRGDGARPRLAGGGPSI